MQQTLVCRPWGELILTALSGRETEKMLATRPAFPAPPPGPEHVAVGFPAVAAANPRRICLAHEGTEWKAREVCDLELFRDLDARLLGSALP
jgi:hypothetical protein